MEALLGNEVCSETIVIRSNDEWKNVVRSLRFDGERYESVPLRDTSRLELEPAASSRA